MSADDTIAIVKINEKYYAARCQGIEQLHEVKGKELAEIVMLYFGNAEEWDTEEEAGKEAFRISDEHPAEYGIGHIGEFEITAVHKTLSPQGI